MNKTIYILAATLLLSACEKTPEGLDESISGVTFKAGITTETRVLSNAFEAGDEISVVAYDGSALYANKASYTYDGSLFTSSAPITYSGSDQTLSFIASYPVVEGLSDSFNFAVEADQSADDNFEMSDLLVASQDATSELCPTLVFDHVMSSIVIDVPSTVANGEMKFFLAGEAIIDVANESYTASDEATEIVAAANGDASYKVIFAPQTIPAGSVVATYVANGKSYTWTVSSSFTFVSGYRYEYNWEIDEQTNVDEVTYVGNIKGWNDEVLTDEKTDGYLWNELKYNQIDFDAVYGECSGATLVSNITAAINNAGDNDMIVFKSESYDFAGNSLTISVPARLSGKIPSSIDDDVVGAQNITTTFNDAAYIRISTNDVELYHLELIDEYENYGFIKVFDTSNNTYFVNTTTFREGLVFSNIRILQGSAQVYAGNGSGSTFRYVTFRDFTGTGYITNRVSALDESPQTIFKYCLFESPSQSGYNLRGISHDCGNSEYPIPVDLNETLIDNCHFYRTGIGFSKCQNAKVTNCYIYSNSMYMDQVHLEEYTRNIEVSNNVFEHGTVSRGFYIDRERQCVSDITITNNKYIGEVGWVISSYSPSSLTFENNDFTEARFSTYTAFPYDFDFSYYTNDEEKEGFEFEVPTHNLIIRNNPGLELTGGMRIFVEEGNNTNIIDVDGAVVTEVPNPADVQPIPNGKYYLQNLSTGQYISFGESGDYVSLSSEADEDCIWNTEFVAPQNYAITSSDDEYMWAYASYTLSHLQNRTCPSDKLVRKSTFPSGDRVPNFLLQHPIQEAYSEYYIIYPGDNERKSALGVIDGHVDIEFGKVTESYGTYASATGKNVSIAPEDNEFMLWKLIPVVE